MQLQQIRGNRPLLHALLARSRDLTRSLNPVRDYRVYKVYSTVSDPVPSAQGINPSVLQMTITVAQEQTAVAAHAVIYA